MTVPQTSSKNDKGTRATPELEGAFDFQENLAAVIVGKNVGYIRRDGSFAQLPLHQSASGIDFSEGLAALHNTVRLENRPLVRELDERLGFGELIEQSGVTREPLKSTLREASKES